MNELCLWCANAHVANSMNGCYCNEKCAADWCLFGDDATDPLAVRFC